MDETGRGCQMYIVTSKDLCNVQESSYWYRTYRKCWSSTRPNANLYEISIVKKLRLC